MDIVYERVCGLDIHKDMIAACMIKKGRRERKQFGTMTDDLLQLSAWLIENDCQMTAMESTGSYWKPIYNILEAENVPVIIANAQHIKAVPGRKTDVKDSEWIADLLRHGLVNASFVPPRELRDLRELVRYRKSLIQERAREFNRIQKVLEGANIKLGSLNFLYLYPKQAHRYHELSAQNPILFRHLQTKTRHQLYPLYHHLLSKKHNRHFYQNNV